MDDPIDIWCQLVLSEATSDLKKCGLDDLLESDPDAYSNCLMESVYWQLFDIGIAAVRLGATQSSDLFAYLVASVLSEVASRRYLVESPEWLTQVDRYMRELDERLNLYGDSVRLKSGTYAGELARLMGTAAKRSVLPILAVLLTDFPRPHSPDEFWVAEHVVNVPIPPILPAAEVVNDAHAGSATASSPIIFSSNSRVPMRLGPPMPATDEELAALDRIFPSDSIPKEHLMQPPAGYEVDDESHREGAS